MQHKLLLATHPAAFRVPSVLKVRHCKSWTLSRAVPASALFGDLFPLSHLGVCLFFQEAHFADQTSRKPLIFVWLFSVPSVTCRSKGGSGGWDQRLQKDPCSNNQAVGLLPPNPDKAHTLCQKMWGRALHIPLLLGALKTCSAVSKTCYSSYC